MSRANPSPLLSVTRAAGGQVADYHGLELVRHFGDPAGEYGAATSGAAVFDRGHRGRLRVSGRAPVKMLDGILTGRIPGEPGLEGDVWSGTATYHAVLTPKGKMITDLWCHRLGAEDGAGLLLDVPVAGVEGLLAHLGKFLPPRFAKVTNLAEETGALTVTGPDAAGHLSRLALGLRVEASELTGMREGEWRAVGATPDEALVITRTLDVWPEAFDVAGPAGAVVALWKALCAAGARPAGLGVWSTLRVEAGRPAYGTDMDDATIPVEAAIHDRAIDYGKGCYTGQEVIVRIRDRGHVNRTLTLVHLGDVPTPKKGTELFVEGSDRPAAVVTSAVASPRFGETVALAYVRRGMEGTLRPH